MIFGCSSAFTENLNVKGAIFMSNLQHTSEKFLKSNSFLVLSVEFTASSRLFFCQAETRAEFAERTVAKLEKSIDDLEGIKSVQLTCHNVLSLSNHTGIYFNTTDRQRQGSKATYLEGCADVDTINTEPQIGPFYNRKLGQFETFVVRAQYVRHRAFSSLTQDKF